MSLYFPPHFISSHLDLSNSDRPAAAKHLRTLIFASHSPLPNLFMLSRNRICTCTSKFLTQDTIRVLEKYYIQNSPKRNIDNHKNNTYTYFFLSFSLSFPSFSLPIVISLFLSHRNRCFSKILHMNMNKYMIGKRRAKFYIGKRIVTKIG